MLVNIVLLHDVALVLLHLGMPSAIHSYFENISGQRWLEDA